MGLFGKKKKKEKITVSELKISVNNEGKEYTFTLEGRLDTVTSPSLEEKINGVVGDAEKLIFDLSALEFITSAGLRVLLGALQQMDEKGGMIIRDPSPMTRDVIELTGFSRLFTIE
ncbi:MAG: STAS domain-containing protein [Ruminococcus sp.]|nr:STAS domain-containing protein [Ruminococcus sp.]